MKVIRHIVAAGALATSCIAGASTDADMSRLPAPETLESFLDHEVAALMQAHDVPGVTVAVVADNQVAFAKGYGFADITRTVPVDPDTTIFRAGSISKTFTWTAVMQLVEQGAIDLDSDVNEYITQFQIPDTFDEPITIRHLLAHTAGFEDVLIGSSTSDKSNLTLAEALEAFMPARVRAPGIHASYSNWSTALAGLIVANQSGIAFEEYIEKNIFDPLGMNRSTFREPVPETINGFVSASFVRHAGDYVDGGFEEMQHVAPAGAISTTASDMARFMLAHLNDGTYDGARILEPATAQLMRQPLHRHHEALNAMLYGFSEQTTNGRFSFGHGGDTAFFHSLMTLLPAEGVGIFVSTNAPEGTKIRDELVATFLDEFFPAIGDDSHPATAAPTQPAASSADADLEFFGSYRLNRRPYTTWHKALTALVSLDVTIAPSPLGGLVLSGKGIDTQRYVADNKDVYRSVDDPDGLIAFARDGGGTVRHLFHNEYPYFAADKIGVLEEVNVHRNVLVLAVLIMIGVVFGAVKNASSWTATPGPEKVAFGLLIGAVLLNITFIAVFGWKFVLNFRINGLAGNPVIPALLSLPFVALLCTVGAAAMAFPVWSRQHWPKLRKIRYTATVLVLLVTAWSFNYWNLLGPWYA